MGSTRNGQGLLICESLQSENKNGAHGIVVGTTGSRTVQELESNRKPYKPTKSQVPLDSNAIPPYTLWVMAFAGLNIIHGVMPWLLMLTGMLSG